MRYPRIIACCGALLLMTSCRSGAPKDSTPAEQTPPTSMYERPAIAQVLEPTPSSYLWARDVHKDKPSLKPDLDGHKKDPDTPPPAIFKLIKYPTSLGNMEAYLSPDPGDKKRHPIMIWRIGGVSNAIGDLFWLTTAPQNDQSARQYREAGMLMMYPSLRGAHQNPGQREGLLGEVDDMLDAIYAASKLPYVDPEHIYIGGHSTGGTLALLVAAAAYKGTLRGVVALGPVANIGDYGEIFPIDYEDEDALTLRSPISWLDSIETPTYVAEGVAGNYESLRQLKYAGEGNPHLKFFSAKGDHFSVVAPINAQLAHQFMQAFRASKTNPR